MPEVDTGYWSQFWIQRGRESRSDDPQTQVLRTSRGKPIDGDSFQPILARALSQLELRDSHDVLDLCCGNGIFSIPLTDHCRSVHCVDLSEAFTDSIDAVGNSKLSTQASDIRGLEFGENQFDRILLYAGIQYFSTAEAFQLMSRIFKWLRPNGILLLGDIPDVAKRWAFFRTEEQRRQYFQCLVSGKPIIGTWYESEWLQLAGEAVGFSKSDLLLQPEGFPYAHFRYDMRFHKR